MMSIKVFMNKYPSYSLSQIERLAFIDIRLHYLGEIARSDIMEEFKLAQAAASKDLSEYRKLQGDKVKKDFQTKKTVINDEYFSPLFEIRVDYALDILTNGFNRNYLIETSPTIPIEIIEMPIDKLEDIKIVGITRAMYKNKGVACQYQSSHSENNSVRTLLPTILFINKNEWYFRAFDRQDDPKRSGFKNFKLSRVLNSEYISDLEPSNEEKISSDIDWNTIIPVQIKLNEKLEDKVKRMVLSEFHLSSDTHTIFTKIALFAYIYSNWCIRTETDIEQGNFAYFKLLNVDLYKNIPSLAEFLKL